MSPDAARLAFAMQTVTLHDGGRMPALGLGTWKSAPGEVGAAVREAIRLGYRHIDCAAIYGNEAEVGGALAECLAAGVVARDDFWVTSKLWNDRHAPDDVVPALEQTLADLRLEHLDLYLVHWPVALRKGKLLPHTAADMIGLDELPIAETWRGMEQAVQRGLARYVGVSNFSATKVADLARRVAVPPAVNQVELHPYLQQTRLLKACREHGVAVTAYAPLGSPDRPASMRQPDEPRLLDEPIVAEVARRLGATPAQVLIAWALRRGTAVIPKSVSPRRLAENLAAADLELDGGDMAAIAALDRNRRYVDGVFWQLPGGPYTVASLWDD